MDYHLHLLIRPYFWLRLHYACLPTIETRKEDVQAAFVFRKIAMMTTTTGIKRNCFFFLYSVLYIIYQPHSGKQVYASSR